MPDAAAAGDSGELAERVRAVASGLEPLVAQAEAVRRARAVAERAEGTEQAEGTDERPGAPRWTDVFTTQFTEFSNRPR